MHQATAKQPAEATKVPVSVPVSSGKCGFEGGQMPLYRRLPKRGFTCRNSKEIVAINVSMLNVFDNDTVVDIDALKSVGLISNPRDGVKILGEGDLEKKADS